MKTLYCSSVFAFCAVLFLSCDSNPTTFRSSVDQAGASNAASAGEQGVKIENVSTASPVVRSTPVVDSVAAVRVAPVVQATPVAAAVSPYVTNPALAYGTCGAPCAGESKVIYNEKYHKYVKVVLCSRERYDLFMGEAEAGPFYKIGDNSGHGQDHCELVNPTFTNPIDDDVASGTCPTCRVMSAGNQIIPALWGIKMYHRSRMNEGFQLAEDVTQRGILTSCWYECGASF